MTAGTRWVVGGGGGTRRESAARAAFSDVGLGDESLVRALEGMEITEPTEIQAKAIEIIGRGPGNVFVASHTGSGKTLAYLLPVIERMKRAEEEAGERLAKPKRPKVVVTCPTRELTAEQVAEVAKALSHVCKFSSYLVVGGKSLGKQKERLDSPIDVIIGTPGRLIKHVEQGNLFLGGVDSMVLDEADTLFEAGFGDEVKRLLRPLKARPEGKTCVLVSATMPDRLRKLVDEELPGLQYVRTDSLHRSAPGLKHRFIDCRRRRQDDGARTNRRSRAQTGQKIDGFLQHPPLVHRRRAHHVRGGYSHRAVPRRHDGDARAEAMRDFIAADADDNLTMVCTDLAARGLDFGRMKVDHVVNFDFPLNSLDYIHRSGRTAARAPAAKSPTSSPKKTASSPARSTTPSNSAFPSTTPRVLAPSPRLARRSPRKRRETDARVGGGAVPPSAARDKAARAPRSNRGRRGASRFQDSSGKSPPSSSGRRGRSR